MKISMLSRVLAITLAANAVFTSAAPMNCLCKAIYNLFYGAPTCKTINCKQQCAKDKKGNYYDYCGMTCIPKGQLCTVPNCYEGCVKNANGYFDLCAGHYQTKCKTPGCKKQQWPGYEFCGKQCALSNTTQNTSTEIKYFYDDNPGNQNSYNQPYYFLGNFWSSTIKLTINSIVYTFPNAEAAYQAIKFTSQPTILNLLTKVRSGYEAWHLAQQNKNTANNKIHTVNTNTGKTYKVEWMELVVQQKFAQNDNLANLLIKTGSSTLIEWTINDNFWGVTRNNGQGDNMLGKIQMQVRQQLKNKQLKKNPSVTDSYINNVLKQNKII